MSITVNKIKNILETNKQDEPKGGDSNLKENKLETKQENIKELTEKVKKVSLELYSQASKYALKKGIIIADTKFEFGLDNDDNLYLIDELFTPDSSRFWPVKSYKLGSSPKSFDKQYIRDYLETLDWNKEAPGPQIPEKIGQKTSEKYFEAFDKLTG